MRYINLTVRIAVLIVGVVLTLSFVILAVKNKSWGSAAQAAMAAYACSFFYRSLRSARLAAAAHGQAGEKGQRREKQFIVLMLGSAAFATLLMLLIFSAV